MRASTVLLPLLLLHLLVLSIDATSMQEHKWLIEGSCRLASALDGRFSKDYCTSALRNAAFDEKAKSSLHGLAWISANLLYTNVTSTKAKLDGLSARPNNIAHMSALAHCTSMYNEASHRAKECLKYMEEKSYAEADRTVSMIQGDGYECQTAFVSEPGLISPLTKENLDTQYLSAITTLLIRFFDKSYTPWGLPVLKTPFNS